MTDEKDTDNGFDFEIDAEEIRTWDGMLPNMFSQKANLTLDIKVPSETDLHALMTLNLLLVEDREKIRDLALKHIVGWGRVKKSKANGKGKTDVRFSKKVLAEYLESNSSFLRVCSVAMLNVGNGFAIKN